MESGLLGCSSKPEEDLGYSPVSQPVPGSARTLVPATCPPPSPAAGARRPSRHSPARCGDRTPVPGRPPQPPPWPGRCSATSSLPGMQRVGQAPGRGNGVGVPSLPAPPQVQGHSVPQRGRGSGDAGRGAGVCLAGASSCLQPQSLPPVPQPHPRAEPGNGDLHAQGSQERPPNRPPQTSSGHDLASAGRRVRATAEPEASSHLQWDALT